MKLLQLLRLPPNRYSTARLVRWLWRAWRGNRLQASLNALVGLAGVAVSSTNCTCSCVMVSILETPWDNVQYESFHIAGRKHGRRIRQCLIH